MSAVSQSVASSREGFRQSRGAMWFGLFGGAIAWTAHLILAYAAAEFGCVGRIGDGAYLGISLVAWLEIALTLITTLTAGAATAVALRQHRRLQATADNVAENPERYIAWTGVLTSGMFTFVIVFESIPILYYLQTC
jgi:hypothetical protein